MPSPAPRNLARAALLAAFIVAPTAAQFPPWNASWQMNTSTAAMVCSYTGYMDPSTTTGWGLLDFDVRSVS
jgi:hypothetical protein